jgi:hypothetical protein
MNILGTTQKAAGIEGADVGTLVLGEGAKCSWTVSCVHTEYGTPAASAIGSAMFDLWLSNVVPDLEYEADGSNKLVLSLSSAFIGLVALSLY